MKSRIAFAIASMIEPDIIILDEIFAVGDSDFRKRTSRRCRASSITATRPRSWSRTRCNPVRAQCNKVLWLDKGAHGHVRRSEHSLRRIRGISEHRQAAANRITGRNTGKPAQQAQKNTGKRLAEAAVYLMLLLVIIAGCFVWSQYDLLSNPTFSRRVSPSSR